MRVAVYTRLSLDITGGHQTATRRQERACRAFASAREWTVATVFEDVDRSAYQLDVHRPGFEHLVEAVESGAVDGVLVWKLDRLVRRPVDFERFWRACDTAGVFLASVTEPIDSSTEIGLAVIRILVTFAELESATKSIRLKAKCAEAARAGTPPAGPAPYGYTDRYRTIVEPEAAVIRETAARFVAGEPADAIARHLTARGVRNRRGGPFDGSQLRRLLARPALAGKRSHLGIVVADGHWPAILDHTLWSAVTARLGATAKSAGTTRPSRYRRLLRCDRCSNPLYGHTQHGRPVYECRGRQGCTGLSIDADLVDRYLDTVIAWRAATGPAEADDTGAAGRHAQTLAALAAQLERQPTEPAALTIWRGRLRATVADAIDGLDAPLTVAECAPSTAGDAYVRARRYLRSVRITPAVFAGTLDHGRIVLDWWIPAPDAPPPFAADDHYQPIRRGPLIGYRHRPPPPTPPAPGWVTTDAALAILGIRRSETLAHYRRLGLIASRRLGNRWWYPQQALERLAQQLTCNPRPLGVTGPRGRYTRRNPR